ncbi:MAG TPA: PilW family protein [Albitalea sp.]|jgi:type IV pilus assembly protein PilW|nr:PilW family protein [Albitalea sp.]
MALNPNKPRRASAGVSLVELLVAMAIGLVLTMAVAVVMTNSEAGKRTANSANDTSQTAAYTSYVLDRTLRSAGSGYAQRWGHVFGCRINASLNNAQILPRTTPLPAPFAGVPTEFRLAPILVSKGAGVTGSDVITVMAGTAAFGETAPQPLSGSLTADSLRLRNTLGVKGDDLILLGQQDQVGCLVQGVEPGFVGSTDQQLRFAGSYYTAAGADVSVTSFDASGYAISIGNAADNPPQFQMITVGANDTLFSYDVMRTGAAGDTPVAIADGVVEMRALYGIDVNRDGILDQWVDPGAPPYDRVTLMNGSAVSRTNLRQIVALRLGLILRTSLIERQLVSPSDVVLFNDLGAALKQTRTLSVDEQHMRHRAVEITIPLRNVLLAPAVP